jgi:2-polyprenyl-6-hydroxyphenyl methylase/3-demethylubiquinone-9 3-methyltransferase
MSYYVENLAGERLRRCYEVASPRVERYLRAEVEHVRGRLRPGERVLELGCGYGRAAFGLAPPAGWVVGIDSAVASLSLGRSLAPAGLPCDLLAMDALALAFPAATFDAVVCIQNGICAFGVDRARLVAEAVRVCRPGGRLLFSSYAAAFWPQRLAWFEAQAAGGLLGPLDPEATGGGVIVCRDGFRAEAMSPADFQALWRRLDLVPEITEVDGSSLFCESTV